MGVRRPDGRRMVATVALFVVYLATAKLGLSFDALGGLATTVWPPTGIALAALFQLGIGVWPGIALAAFVVNHQAGASLATAAIIATGNTLEAVVGAALLRRVGFHAAMTRLRDVFALVAVAMASTALSATLGSVAVWLGGARPATGYAVFWSVWWLGDFIGDLLVASMLLTWSMDLRLGHNYRRWIEAAALAALLVVGGMFAFGDLLKGRGSEIIRGTYVVWPLLIWASLRLGPRGATTALFIVSAVAIWCTARGQGPFVRQTPHDSLRLLQSYVAVTAVTIMTLAAALAERRRAVMARDDFLSIASHELKTPLTALRLKLESAARLFGPGPMTAASADKLAQAITVSERQVHRLTRLIDDLLDATRLRADRLSLNLEAVCLADLVRETTARFGEEAARAGCAIELDLPARLEVMCDRGRVEQVVTNLVANAIKYAPGRPIRVEVRRQEERVRIAVRDRGGGIASSEQRRIFEPYRRLASVQHLGGLGLGLYIGRQIAEAHGGALTVASEPGAGSEFTLELPLESPSRARPKGRA